MDNVLQKVFLLVFAGVLAGCSWQKAEVKQPLSLDYANREKVMQSAEKTLMSIGFAVEKYDVENGFIRSRPLRGGQFFEVWRGDSASKFEYAESNLQSLQRTAELTFASAENSITVECVVAVRRLSMPEQPIRGFYQAPALYTVSDQNKHLLKIMPELEKEIQWIDLGRDQALENKILTAIQKKTQKG